MIRVAAVQAAPAFLDREATVEKAVGLIAEAAAGGAALVAFPETWIPGYPAWIFGAAGWDDAAQKRAFGRLNANAVEVPSPPVDALCRAAKEAGGCCRHRDDGTRREGFARNALQLDPLRL